MLSTTQKYSLILLLTSAAPLLVLKLGLVLYDKYRTLRYHLLYEDYATVFLRELTNWRTLVATLIAIALPSYLVYQKGVPGSIKQLMSSFFNNGPSAGPSRSLLSRKRWRNNVDDETYSTVMKRGGYIGGLVNDGNTCFMNSVIQSLSSSNTLISLLEDEEIQGNIETRELVFIKSLRTLICKLNSKHLNHGRDYKTTPMLKTMSKTPNKNFLLGYNQEDAQEFFQTILSELESDLKKISKEPGSDSTSSPGSPKPPNPSSTSKNGPIYKKDLPVNAIFGNQELGHLGDVFVPANQIDPNLEHADEKVFRYNLLTPVDGLSAERIGCLNCGEMGGIRYSVISGMSLNLPSDNYAAVRLTELLDKWIEPEILEGVDCNRCALNHVLEFQLGQLEKLNESPASSKLLIEKLAERVDTIKHELTKPIIDDDVVKKLFTQNMMKKSSKSKEILISRPPPLLAIHINRSVFDPMTYRVRKNTAKVLFPLKLDLDPYVAEPDEINTDARLPLSKKAKVVPEPQEEEVLDEEEEGEEGEKEDEESMEFDNNEGLADSQESKTPSELSEDEELTSQPPLPERSFSGDESARPESDLESASELDSDDSGDDDDDEEEEENLRIRHTAEIPASIEKQDISGPLVYQLRSVIVHYGTHNYGHYIAYRKYRGVWWRTSDENVEIVDEDEVLSAPGVFMLFYELDSLCKELAKDEEEVENVTETTVQLPIERGQVEMEDSVADELEDEDQDDEVEVDEDQDDEAQQHQSMSIANL